MSSRIPAKLKNCNKDDDHVDDDGFQGRGRGESRRGNWVRSGPILSCPSNLTTTEDPCLLLITSPRWHLWASPSPTSPHSLSPSLPHPDRRSWLACRGQPSLPLPVAPTLVKESFLYLMFLSYTNWQIWIQYDVLVGMDTVIRELLPQQQPRTIERRDLQYITISKEELTSSDSLSPDPWKRDAREKAEKQQQLHIVDLLDKEIQELQVGTV